MLQGRDNPSATGDDGSNLKNNPGVISNQPQSIGNERAELPVSAVAWSSNHVSPLRPMHGLDFLIGVSTLHIQQTVEINHLRSSIESENLYTVKVPNGQTLYLASEKSSKTQRLLLGVRRAFTMQLHDNTRQRVMDMERRLAAASCCFPCRLQVTGETRIIQLKRSERSKRSSYMSLSNGIRVHEQRSATPSALKNEMRVIKPPGDYLGCVQQQWTWVVPFYLVRNVNDDVLYVIEGPTSLDNRNLIFAEFKILTSDSLRQVGKISHSWDREVNNFVTAIEFPHCAVEPKHKALLLAATFLLEYTYFERAKTSCLRFNCC